MAAAVARQAAQPHASSRTAAPATSPLSAGPAPSRAPRAPLLPAAVPERHQCPSPSAVPQRRSPSETAPCGASGAPASPPATRPNRESRAQARRSAGHRLAARWEGEGAVPGKADVSRRGGCAASAHCGPGRGGRPGEPLAGAMEAEAAGEGPSVLFLHPDLGLGGAERLVVDAALALQARGCRVQIWTAHYDPERCFAETRGLSVQQAGGWLPRSLWGRGHALCAALRMVFVALYILLLSGQRVDAFVCDQVRAGRGEAEVQSSCGTDGERGRNSSGVPSQLYPGGGS